MVARSYHLPRPQVYMARSLHLLKFWKIHYMRGKLVKERAKFETLQKLFLSKLPPTADFISWPTVFVDIYGCMMFLDLNPWFYWVGGSFAVNVAFKCCNCHLVNLSKTLWHFRTYLSIWTFLHMFFFFPLFTGKYIYFMFNNFTTIKLQIRDQLHCIQWQRRCYRFVYNPWWKAIQENHKSSTE